MDKSLLQIFAFLSLVILNNSIEIRSEDSTEYRVYDLKEVFTKTSKRLQNALILKELGLPEVLHFKGIDEAFEFIPSGSSQSYLKCLFDLAYTLNNTKSRWALNMIDSFGKPESGILRGNFRWIGDYNECIGVQASYPKSSAVDFRGRYCSLSWSLSPLNLSIPIPIPFTTGVCIPDSCSGEEFKEDALQILHMAGSYPYVNETWTVLNGSTIQCKPMERHLTTAAKLVIALLSLFCAVAAIGSSITAIQYFKKVLQDSKSASNGFSIFEGNPINGGETNIFQNTEDHDITKILRDEERTSETNVWLQKLETFFKCFCVFTNGAKLLNTQSSEGELLCIHGIRFLSMSWVILGHTYTFGNAEMNNILALEPLVNNFAFQAVIQGLFSVDSFFVLSGFLLAYLSMKQFSKSDGKISWPYFYIHRYIRLTPIYMILIGYWTTVWNYMGSGPFWIDKDVDPDCKARWWENLIYINNFDDSECFGWSWYLANDMQFFVISPIFLISLWRWPKIGYSLIAVFLCANSLSNFFITYHFDLPVGIATVINNGELRDMVAAQAKFNNYFTKIYVKPYTRIGPYLIGLLVGYLLFKRKERNNTKHSLMFVCTGWIIATSVTLANVYGLYHRHQSLAERSIYNAFSRTCWGMGLCWVIYICLIGQGGVVNRILSFKFFIPFSRLTYAAYLIHPMIIMGYFGSLKTMLEFSHPSIVILFLGFMVVTYALALPVALVLESPIVVLEKLVRKRFVKEQ